MKKREKNFLEILIDDSGITQIKFCEDLKMSRLTFWRYVKDKPEQFSAWQIARLAYLLHQDEQEFFKKILNFYRQKQE